MIIWLINPGEPLPLDDNQRLFRTGKLAYKLKDVVKITSQAKKELTRVEEEFNSYKKKSLVRDQKLRRQLQDEINKQRGI